MSNRIFLSSPHMSDAGYEMEYINRAFETNWIAPLGENVDKFELEMCDWLKNSHEKSGAPKLESNNICASSPSTAEVYASALSSGTSAIHLALLVSGVGKGDIVFVSSLTFSASVNPIIYVGATPVFIDAEYDSWNMDPALLRSAFVKYPNAKACIAVNLYGNPAKLDEIADICKEYGATLIEDAAESLGSSYKGIPTALYGEYGILSFNGNKIITTSGGGMLIGRNSEKIAKSRFYATQSREKERHYEHKEIGYNYRMSNVVAGIGRGQLKVLDDRINKKKYIYNYYKSAFAEIPEIDMMPTPEFADCNYWLSCITLKTISPIAIIEALDRENIESRPVWKPMHKQPIFAEYDVFGGAVSEDIFARGLCLPSDTKMTDDELLKIVSIIKNTISSF